MITESLSALKIHKLTQEQYNRELLSGNVDKNALYLTPDEEIDLSPYAIKEEVSSVYETKTDANIKLTEAKSYADDVKNDLLNGAGAAYDTLKELGELIDENTDAIDALEAIAAGKQAAITGAATTITSNNLTANRALVSNGSGKVAVSSVTSTELGYLSGVTSSVQTQLDNKANSSSMSNYYTKTEINNMELITIDDIDNICGTNIVSSA